MIFLETEKGYMLMYTNMYQSLYILRRPQNFAKSPPYFCLYVLLTKVKMRVRKIFWPSQDIRTLPLLRIPMVSIVFLLGSEVI